MKKMEQKTKEQFIEEIKILQQRIKKLEKSESERKKTEKAFLDTKKELEIQTRGLRKANETIRYLYKEMEEKNKELQKLDQLKNDFVSVVSHELRTPLTTMKEFTSIILDEIPGKLNKGQREYVDIVKGNIDRLTRLISDLLDISRIEAGRIELNKTLVDMPGLVNAVVTALKPEVDKKHITLKTSFQTATADVYADPGKINQVLINLIGNAIKFTPAKGQVTVEIKDMGKMVECSVVDRGVGIAPENTEKLFTKFQQFGRAPGTGAKGTGLGLAISKELVQMHDGAIRAESKLKRGTKFIFTLPKYSTEVLFRDHINKGIREAAKKNSKMTLIVVSMGEFEKLKKKLTEKEFQSILSNMEKVLKDSLRREGDIIVKDIGEIVLLLADCDKESAANVEKRLRGAVNSYLAKKEMAKKINLRFGRSTYPEDASSDEELIAKAKQGMVHE